MPAATAWLTASAGNVFDTATSVTSRRSRPARAQAAATRAFTSATLARISSRLSTAPLDGPSIRAIDGGIREPVRVLVAGAQRVADREPAELPRHRFRADEQRNQIRMLHAVLAEHLSHEQLRVGDDLDLARPLGFRRFERFEETGVLGDVV